MKNRFSFGLGAAVLAVALGGCAGSPGTSTSSAPPTSSSVSAPSTAEAGAEMKVASSSAGPIVVDGKGMSLYFFTKDVLAWMLFGFSNHASCLWPLRV